MIGCGFARCQRRNADAISAHDPAPDIDMA
jgi:hypothetical protein